MEIGSFIEMQFTEGKEYHSGDKIARFNSGRAAIYHATRCLDCKKVYLPYYQCDTVRDFLKRKGIEIKYYFIDSTFTPLLDVNELDSAVVIVNYYGIMSNERLQKLAANYSNVIIDNSQAFFAIPLENTMSVYSARKFVGVPDGAYVAGKNATDFIDDYEQDYSSDTSLFLLQRIEYGCEGKIYESRIANEHRIDISDIKLMSKLTHVILDGTDYELIMKRRRKNFNVACDLFGDFNKINPLQYYGSDCVPMVYPLVVEDDMLLDRLLKAKHFQGHWWSYLLNEVPENSFEHKISRYVIPITIDQRYGKNELTCIYDVVRTEI